jgi:DNA repair protein NreA
MPKKDCITCKGRYYTTPLTCGHAFCPVYSKVYEFKKKKLEKKEFLGTAPTVFVGRYNYPNLNVGIMAPPDVIEKDAILYDAPSEWNKRKFQVQDVLDFRSALINSKFQTHIKSRPKFLEMSQEVAMASKPVDMEFHLEKKPYYSFTSSKMETVMGPRAVLQKVSFHSTPKVDRKVDYVVSDTDLKSAKALNILYKKGYDETFLTRLLSVGTLGVKKNRKLVPTRWSITATDDTLGKELIKEVKDYKLADYHICFGGYMGNYFLFLFFPRVWSYELFEMYMPSTLLNPDLEMKYTTDFEFFSGRKTYATNTAGGYYACRLGLLEYLRSIKRQSAVVVLRFITDEYSMPLGVWVVREAAREALKKKSNFESELEMMSFAKKLIFDKFSYNCGSILKDSEVLAFVRKQRTIRDYF